MINLNSNNVSKMISNNLSRTKENLDSTFQKVSSGSRINGARDDAAGLATSTKLSSSSRSMDVAHDNIRKAISYLNTVDGMLETAVEAFQVLREKTVSALDVRNEYERVPGPGSRNGEYHTLYGWDFEYEMRFMQKTLFKTKDANSEIILNSGHSLTFQVGENQNDTFTVTVGDMSLEALRTRHGNFLRNWNTHNANQTIPNIDSILGELSQKRAEIGGSINALMHRANSLSETSTNTKSALSRITDADFAKETASIVKHEVMQEASMAALKQANSNKDIALTLLRS